MNKETSCFLIREFNSPKMTHYYMCDKCGKIKKSDAFLVVAPCYSEACITVPLGHGFYKYLGSKTEDVKILGGKAVFELEQLYQKQDNESKTELEKHIQSLNTEANKNE